MIDRGHMPGRPPDEATTQITATCAAQSANLRVVDPRQEGHSNARWLSRRRRRRRRAQVLALAELVVASWSELESNPEPKAATAAPLAPKSAREAARRVIAPLPIELAALIDAQLLASRDSILGGGARTEIWVSSSLFLRFDALAHYAELSRPTDTSAHDAGRVGRPRRFLRNGLARAATEPRRASGLRLG